MTRLSMWPSLLLPAAGHSGDGGREDSRYLEPVPGEPRATISRFAAGTARLRAARSRVVVLLAVCLPLLLTPRSAWAYRPFVSTDAAVADPREMEIEVGYFQFARTREDDVFTTPKVVLNYGLDDRLEIVGEFAVETGAHEDLRLVDPALFLKAVVREGALQEKKGLSLALEAGPLLPSMAPGEDGVGFEATGIASGRLAPLTYHLNLGGGVTREDKRGFATWGLITEVSVVPSFRLVGEVNGESVEDERPNNAALLGFIWQPFAPKRFWVDAGIRRGITPAAPDWQATLGFTIGFDVFGKKR